MFLIFVLYNVLAAQLIISKLLMNAASPFFTNAIALTCGGVGVLLIQKLVYKRTVGFPWVLGVLLCFIALVGGYFDDGFSFWSLKENLSAAKMALLNNFAPFLAGIVSYFFLGEDLTKKKVLGIVIGILGIMPMLLVDEPGERAAYGIGFLSLAEILELITCVGCVLYAVGMRKLLTVRHIPFYVATGWTMILAAIPCIVTSILCEPWHPVPITHSTQFWALLPVYIVVTGGIYTNLYAYLLTRYTATLITFLAFIAPCITSLFSWLFFGEPVTLTFMVSMSIVTCGFYLFYTEEKRQGYI